MKKTKVAICYDFDGTFFPKTILDYDFLNKIGIDADTFWDELHSFTKKMHSDHVLAYMHFVMQKVKEKKLPFTHQLLHDIGKNLPLFPGVDTWFDRINQYGKENGLIVEHYLISSGLLEVIKGNAISKKFKHIYASSFMYDEKGNTIWPALAINYTNKTQYLFRINKGCMNIDDPSVNAFLPNKKRYIPLSRFIYIGDGFTDVPCMRLIKNENGHSIAVYDPEDEKNKGAARQLFKEGRVNFMAKADYGSGSTMEKIVHVILDKIKVDSEIEDLKKHCRRTK